MCRLHCRFGRRKPFLSAVGRLDKDTSGLLLMTDDGQLLHSIQSPTKGTVSGTACRTALESSPYRTMLPQTLAMGDAELDVNSLAAKRRLYDPCSVHFHGPAI